VPGSMLSTSRCTSKISTLGPVLEATYEQGDDVDVPPLQVLQRLLHMNPLNYAQLGAGPGLKALAYSSCQRTRPASKPQSASDTAIVQLQDAV
jgi:hypothetical protein